MWKFHAHCINYVTTCSIQKSSIWLCYYWPVISWPKMGYRLQQWYLPYKKNIYHIMLHVGLGEIAGLTNLDFSMEQYWVLSKAAVLSAVQWESINGLQKYRDTASSTSAARQGLLPVSPWGEAPRWRNSPLAAWQFSRYYKDIIIACKSEGCTQLRNLRARGWVL